MTACPRPAKEVRSAPAARSSIRHSRGQPYTFGGYACQP
jgi:hypothetical protein